MTRGRFLLGSMAATLALSVTPALAQRSSGGGETTGSAVSRGGGDSGGSSGGNSGSSSSSSSGSSSTSTGSSGGSASSAPSSPTAREYVTAPSRPSEREQGRQRGDGGSREPSSGRAVPRGDGGGSSTTRSAGDTSSSASAPSSGDPSRRAVPTYSRPRDGRPATGTAVERQTPRPNGNGIYPYYPGFNAGYGYGRYYWPGAFGLGFYYDPLYYDPFYAGGFGSGYYGAGYGNPYGGYQGGGYGAGSYTRAGTGSLRLKIKPRDAQVYVDGYFVGTVDQFDGLFQKLGVDAGAHRIEIKAEGHEDIQFDVLITPGETVTYKGELKHQ
jgi:hypothetical protein